MKPGTTNFHTVVAGTAYSFVSLVTVSVLGIASSIAVARLLGKTNLGLVATVSYVMNLLSLFALVGIPTAATKHVAEYASSEPTKVGAVMGTSMGLILPPLILLCALLFGMAPRIAVGLYHEPALTPLLRIAAGALLVTVLGTNGFGQALLQGLKEIRAISLINIATNAVGLPITVGLTILFHVTGTIVALLIVALLGAGLVLATITNRLLRPAPVRIPTPYSLLTTHSPDAVGAGFGPFRFERRLVRGLLNIAVPAFLAGLVMTPALWFTTTRLSQLRGFGEVGLFNICFAAFQMILFVPMAVGMPLIPLIAESGTAGTEKTRRLMQSAIDGVGFVTCVLAAGLSLFAHPLIRLLYGAGYTDATPAMTLIAGAAFLSSLGYVLGHYFAGTGKMWTGMGFNLVWFGTMIGLSFLFIGRLGAAGLALDFLLSYLVMTIGILIYARRVICLQVRYPAILCVLSVGVAAASLVVFRQLHGTALWAYRMGTLLAAAALGYWWLPAKADFRRGVAYVRLSIGERLGRTR
jgi:O-antigen/teichoic acid export membrane protein